MLSPTPFLGIKKGFQFSLKPFRTPTGSIIELKDTRRFIIN